MSVNKPMPVIFRYVDDKSKQVIGILPTSKHGKFGDVYFYNQRYRKVLPFTYLMKVTKPYKIKKSDKLYQYLTETYGSIKAS